MTPELHAMLITWIESGTDAQKMHARHRLSLPDAIGYEKPPGWTPIEQAPRPSVASFLVDSPDDLRVRLTGLRACPYASPIAASCCTHLGTHCHHLRRAVMAGDCLDCLPAVKEPSP